MSRQKINIKKKNAQSEAQSIKIYYPNKTRKIKFYNDKKSIAKNIRY